MKGCYRSWGFVSQAVISYYNRHRLTLGWRPLNKFSMQGAKEVQKSWSIRVDVNDVCKRTKYELLVEAGGFRCPAGAPD